jgi:AAHS family 4-hydroxybenzoate transporter-like MFS transporter
MITTSQVPSAARTTLNATEWRILAICFGAAMVDGFDTLILSFIAPLVGKQFGLSPVDIGKLFSAGFVGAVIGGLSVGPLADWFGRRSMLLLSLSLAVVFTFLCSKAGSPQGLMVLRFLAGLGLGGAIPTIIALTAEGMPAKLRTAAVTWMFLGIPLGAVVGGAIVAATLALGWQAIFVGGALAAGVLIPLVWLGLPEAQVARDAASVAPIAQARMFGSVRAQFAEGRVGAAIALWLGAFSVILSSFFLLNWMPTVLVGSGFSPERAAIAGVLLNLGGVAGAFIISFAVRRFGAYRPVAIALFIGSLFVSLLGHEVGEQISVLLLAFLSGTCVFGAQLAMPAIAADFYPSAVRGAGVGWTMGIGRIASILAPVIGGALIAANIGWPILFPIVAVPTIVAGLAIWLADRVRPKFAQDTLASHSTGSAGVAPRVIGAATRPRA